MECYGGGSIAGAIFGTIVVIALLGVLALWIYKKYYCKLRKGKWTHIHCICMLNIGFSGRGWWKWNVWLPRLCFVTQSLNYRRNPDRRVAALSHSLYSSQFAILALRVSCMKIAIMHNFFFSHHLGCVSEWRERAANSSIVRSLAQLASHLKACIHGLLLTSPIINLSRVVTWSFDPPKANRFLQ